MNGPQLVDQTSDVPSIFFFIIFYILGAIKTLCFHFCTLKKKELKGFLQRILQDFMKQALNTFSHYSASQVFQYISFPIFRVSKLPKVQVTQVVQSPSYPSCPASKLPKVQVAQSPSYPKPKLPKVQVAQIAKSSSCLQVKQGQKHLWSYHGKKYL